MQSSSGTCSNKVTQRKDRLRASFPEFALAVSRATKTPLRANTVQFLLAFCQLELLALSLALEALRGQRSRMLRSRLLDHSVFVIAIGLVITAGGSPRALRLRAAVGGSRGVRVLAFFVVEAVVVVGERELLTTSDILFREEDEVWTNYEARFRTKADRVDLQIRIAGMIDVSADVAPEGRIDREHGIVPRVFTKKSGGMLLHLIAVELRNRLLPDFLPVPVDRPVQSLDLHVPGVDVQQIGVQPNIIVDLASLVDLRVFDEFARIANHKGTRWYLLGRLQAPSASIVRLEKLYGIPAAELDVAIGAGVGAATAVVALPDDCIVGYVLMKRPVPPVREPVLEFGLPRLWVELVHFGDAGTGRWIALVLVALAAVRFPWPVGGASCDIAIGPAEIKGRVRLEVDIVRDEELGR